MQNQLEGYIQKHKLFTTNDKILVAVSGGVDSMVLAALLHQLHYNISIAHCNFHLRDVESDGDEAFVVDFAQRNYITNFVTHFDTTNYAAQHSISIEMAARDLRYNWFRQLVRDQGFTKVALAHHANDQIETFFINLFRGSGIHGLKGMLPSHEIFVRPLLWATREQIKTFAIENQIAWREDRTNSETVYLRNKIRLQLVPLIEKIRSGAAKSINTSVSYLASEDALYRRLLNEKLQTLLLLEPSRTSARRSSFDGETGLQLLFEWLRNYNFSFLQCSSMLSAVSGSVFQSTTHQVSVSTKFFELTVINVAEPEINATILKDTQTFRCKKLTLYFEVQSRGSDLKIDASENTAQVDFNSLEFPLTLRQWREGDRFCPLGMRGSKLLSDFFNDLGLSSIEKKQVLLLEDASQRIVWVVGYRIDNRFKIKPQTAVIYTCKVVL